MGNILAGIGGFLVDKIGFSGLKLGIFIALKVITFGIVIAFYTFILSWVVTGINTINTLIDKFESLSSGGTGSSCVAQSFSYGLSCSGVLDGFNNTMPLLLSSVSFVLLVLVHGYVMLLKNEIDKAITNALKLI